MTVLQILGIGTLRSHRYLIFCLWNGTVYLLHSSSSDFWYSADTGAISTTVGPLPGNWLAARMADLTPDLQVSLSWGSIAESFHSLRSLSVSCFQVILGLPGPRFPLTCMSKAVLTAPFERSTCLYQQSLLSFSMRSRSSIPSRASSSVDLMVAVSCGGREATMGLTMWASVGLLTMLFNE